jgi:hypothetical protein
MILNPFKTLQKTHAKKVNKEYEIFCTFYNEFELNIKFSIL